MNISALLQTGCLICKKMKASCFTPKILLVMKMTIFLLLVVCMQVSAEGYSQTVTIAGKDLSLKTVFREIKKQSGYTFFYSDKDLRKAHNVNLNVRNAEIKSVLDRIFDGQPLGYSIIQKTVVVKAISSPQLTLLSSIDIATVNELVFDQVITGKVTDSDGKPLAGASITVKGSSRGTTTDANGNYSLTAPDNAQFLIISMVGYTSSETAIKGSVVNVVLSQELFGLTEVVVTGYTNLKRENITGAVGVISSDQLNDVASPNVSNLLQGKVAGVDVLNSSGRPGSAPAISIRGRSTINSTTAPLWVVDGTIMNATPILNPDDIESISVLKDASSASLYGSRAANGVIVVTTKAGSGAVGTSRIQVNAKAGVSFYNMGNFELMNSDDLVDFWKSFANQSSLPAYFNDSLKNRNTDWIKIGTRDAPLQNYNLSYSSNAERTKIFSSLDYYDEDGTLKGYSFNRLSGRLNLEHKITPKLLFKPRISVNFSKVDNHEHSTYDIYRDLPWDIPYDVNGKPVNARADGVTWFGRDLSNYLYDLQWNYSKQQTLNIESNFDLQYNFNNHFSFKSTNSISYRSTQSMGYVDPRSVSGQSIVGSITNNNTFITSHFTNQMVTFKTNIGKHSINSLVAYEYNNYKSNTLNAAGKGIVPGIIVLDGTASPTSTTGNINEYVFQSYLFNTNYSFAERFVGQFSIRTDGSSRFSKKYGVFYAIGGAWNINKEKFFNSSTINFLRMRVNYGGTGNTPTSNYGFYDLFSVSSQYDGAPSAFPTTLGNSGLRWEKTFTTDLGFEIGLWNKLNITLDLYQKNTSDLVYAVALPAVTGFTQQLRNIGAVFNKGIEASIGYQVVNQTNVKWDINFSIGSNSNRIKELYKDQSVINGNQIYKVGYDINTFYLPKWIGVDPNNGDPLWEVIDGNNGKSSINQFAKATLQVVGKETPDFFGGLNTQFKWKEFSLGISAAYRSGGLVYNVDRETFDNDGAYPTYNSMKLAKGWTRWSPDNKNSTHPLPFFGGNNNSNKPSSRYLEDGTFFRFRNIIVSYRVPGKLTEKLKAKGIEGYVSFDNPFVFTNFSGLDPETVSYPQPKRILFGLSFNF